MRKWIDESLAVKTVDQIPREWTQEVTTAKLFGELSQIAKNWNIDLGIKRSNSLGMILKNNAAMLTAEGIRFKAKHSREGTLWSFTEKKSQEKPSQSSQSSQCQNIGIEHEI